MPPGAQPQQEQRPDVAEKAPAKSGETSSPQMSNALMNLQRVAGNRATAAYVQAKLVVGPADDPAEHEADAIADEVLARLRGPGGGGADDGDGSGDGPRIRRSSSGPDPLGGLEVDPATSNDIDKARSRGSALPGDVRSRMEQGFGQDFSSVRIHQDKESDRLNRALQAQAFTTGTDIFFSGGSYRPQTESGEQLLAHELAHVVQQGGGVSGAPSSARCGPRPRSRKPRAKVRSRGRATSKSDSR